MLVTRTYPVWVQTLEGRWGWGPLGGQQEEVGSKRTAQLQLRSPTEQEVSPKFSWKWEPEAGAAPQGRAGCHVAVEGQENTNYSHLSGGQWSPGEPLLGTKAWWAEPVSTPCWTREGGV